MGKYFWVLALSGIHLTAASQAPVPVREEPRHHLVFENPFVRILDVWIKPGDTTLYHIHATPSVFVTYTNPRVGSQLIGGSPAAGAGISGTVSYDSIAITRVHRVWNEDTIWFHVMDVELVSLIPGNGEPALQAQGLQLLFDKPQARGYKLQLSREQSFSFPASETGYLLLSLEDGQISLQDPFDRQLRALRPGHYEWIEAGRSVNLTCLGEKVVFTILQTK